MTINAAPVVIRFDSEGVQAMMGIFDSVEARMVRFDRQVTRSQNTGSKERVSSTRREVDERQGMYAKLFKEADARDKAAVKAADRAGKQRVKDEKEAADQKVKVVADEAKRKDKIRENSMRMADRYLQQEVRNEATAARQKERADASAAQAAERRSTSMRRRYARAMGRGALSGIGNMVGDAASMVGMGLSLGGGFVVADAVRKDLSFSKAVAAASNMSFIPGTTTREEVAPDVIAGMSRGVQGLANIDKEDVANGIKRYVGLSSDFRGLSQKTSSGKTGLEELAMMATASGTPFETLMESAASVKANNSSMTSDTLLQTMRGILGAGKQGTIPLDQLASSVGMTQSTASAFAGDQTRNQQSLLGLVQLAGKSTGGDAARAAMAVKDFSGEIAKEGSKHGMSDKLVYEGGDSKRGFLAPDQLLANLFKVTGGSYNQSRALLGERAMPLFDSLKPVFDSAEKAQKGSGAGAVQAAVRGFENSSYSREDEVKEFATAMQTDGARIEHGMKAIEVAVEGHAVPFIEKFATAVEKDEKPIEDFVGSIAAAAEFMMRHPWATVFGVMEANMLSSIAKAAIGQTIKEGITASLVGGAGGKGKGDGGFVGAGGALGAFSSALTIATVAITAITAGMLAWDSYFDKKVKDQKGDIATGARVANDIAGTKVTVDSKGNLVGDRAMTNDEKTKALEQDKVELTKLAAEQYVKVKETAGAVDNQGNISPRAAEAADAYDKTQALLYTISQTLDAIKDQNELRAGIQTGSSWNNGVLSEVTGMPSWMLPQTGDDARNLPQSARGGAGPTRK